MPRACPLVGVLSVGDSWWRATRYSGMDEYWILCSFVFVSNLSCLFSAYLDCRIFWYCMFCTGNRWLCGVGFFQGLFLCHFYPGNLPDVMTQNT
jgi:hypothetical protein